MPRGTRATDNDDIRSLTLPEARAEISRLRAELLLVEGKLHSVETTKVAATFESAEAKHDAMILTAIRLLIKA